MKLFNNNPAGTFKNVKQFVTYFQGDNRLGASIKQVNEVIAFANKLERNAVLQQKQPYKINNTAPGLTPIVNSLYNTAASDCQPCGTILVTPGPCSNFYSCTGVKPTPDTTGLPAGSIRITLTLPVDEPATTQLAFGNPSTPGDIISIDKVSESQYIVRVINAITGVASVNSLNNVFFEVNLFYAVDQLFPNQ